MSKPIPELRSEYDKAKQTIADWRAENGGRCPPDYLLVKFSEASTALQRAQKADKSYNSRMLAEATESRDVLARRCQETGFTDPATNKLFHAAQQRVDQLRSGKAA